MTTVTQRATRRSHTPRMADVRTGKLRILATTDLHMHLTAHNFVTDKPSQNPGLAGIATLIDKARAEAADQNIPCLLFDNGDLLQGTAMGDWLAQRPVTPDHPAIACINGLGYDAIGVGNHDLDYGLPYLRDVAAQLSLPMISSNLQTTQIGQLTPSALISCTLPETASLPAQTLQIGVLSVLPSQTALWNKDLLKGVATIRSARDSLRAAVPALRAQGADLIVLLAHMGLDQNNETDDTALPLAQIPGIDVLITGHTHRRFPGADHCNTKDVNSTESTVADIPTVMPGHSGSDLAVLDLTLHQEHGGQWRVKQHASALRRNLASTLPAPAVLAATQKAEHQLRDHLASPAGQTGQDLHNFFALACPTHTCALTARAKALIAHNGLHGLPESDLPLLATSAAHTAGGRDGPENFLYIPKGPVLRRHLWALNPYGNQIWVVRITGAELRARLEHAASVFAQLTPACADQPLHDPLRPKFDFDTIFGLNYVIDPVRPLGKRIVGLSYAGDAVKPQDQFLLATNQFRVAGGGGYPALDLDRVILRSPAPLEEGLRAVLKAPDAPQFAPLSWHRPWVLRPSETLSATLVTAPDGLQFLDELQHLSPQPGQETSEGFVRVKLTF